MIVTEWNAFRSMDLRRIHAMMATPVMIDLRNIYWLEDVIDAGFKYASIGRGDEASGPNLFYPLRSEMALTRKLS